MGRRGLILIGAKETIWRKLVVGCSSESIERVGIGEEVGSVKVRMLVGSLSKR